MEYMGIVEQYQDMSEWWQVRVLIGDPTDSTTQQTVFFQFQIQPTEDEVITVANEYIANMNQPPIGQ
jgi:hypothetical protein